MTELSFAERVRATVREIPVGRVSTYGTIAAICGSPRAARGVGAVLGGEFESELPWWRVVNRNGEITIPAELGMRTLQRTRLEDEAVRFDGSGRIRMELHLWPDVLPDTEVD